MERRWWRASSFLHHALHAFTLRNLLQVHDSLLTGQWLSGKKKYNVWPLFYNVPISKIVARWKRYFLKKIALFTFSPFKPNDWRVWRIGSKWLSEDHALCLNILPFCTITCVGIETKSFCPQNACGHDSSTQWSKSKNSRVKSYLKNDYQKKYRWIGGMWGEAW